MGCVMGCGETNKGHRMTTQHPEALRLAHIFDNPLPPEWPDMVAAAAELRRQHARIAELEAVGAGGVQALSAAPEAIAKLRHLYQNMVNGAVRDTASAKRIAEGLLAPAIEALERATPPAEQQAAPKAAPGELSADSLRHQNKLLAETLGACILASGIVRKDIDGFTGPELLHFGEDLRSMLEVAPQQEVQGPAFVDVSLRTAIAKAVYQQVRVEFDYKLGSWTALDADEQQRIVDSIRGLYTAPQPAPAPLSEMPYEKRKAIQEGEQIGASDAWFHARHNMLDTLDRRNVFRAGFDRGWNAALAAQGGK